MDLSYEIFKFYRVLETFYSTKKCKHVHWYSVCISNIPHNPFTKYIYIYVCVSNVTHDDQCIVPSVCIGNIPHNETYILCPVKMWNAMYITLMMDTIIRDNQWNMLLSSYLRFRLGDGRISYFNNIPQKYYILNTNCTFNEFILNGAKSNLIRFTCSVYVRINGIS